MSDQSVGAALRSPHPLVLVEAPAGCGKTYQGSTFVSDLCTHQEARCLVLTHTHAARSVFLNRIASNRADVRTIDSLIVEIATAYAGGLGLPPDPVTWVRQQPDGYSLLAAKVATFLLRWPMIAAALARRFPVVVCDEHQDSSGAQHAIVMTLLKHGARVRIFADPLQKIFRENELEGANAAWSWGDLKSSAHYDCLDYPHRWEKGCKKLGRWLLEVRDALAGNGKVDLRPGRVPDSVRVIVAENVAEAHDQFRVDRTVADQIYAFARSQPQLLVLTRSNDLARALRGFFNRSIQLWEGNVRDALELLARSSTRAMGDPEELAKAICAFLSQTGVGFTFSAFGDVLVEEARENCLSRRRGKPEMIQGIAKCVVEEPNHRGVGRALKRIVELCRNNSAFASMKIDKYRELYEATRFADFASVDEALSAITQRRAHVAQLPPDRAISNIHKAKGLESSAAILINCTRATFPDTDLGRRLLYVGLTRASASLLITVSAKTPSPLVQF